MSKTTSKKMLSSSEHSVHVLRKESFFLSTVFNAVLRLKFENFKGNVHKKPERFFLVFCVRSLPDYHCVRMTETSPLEQKLQCKENLSRVPKTLMQSAAHSSELCVLQSTSSYQCNSICVCSSDRRFSHD